MSSTPLQGELFLADEGVDFRIIKALRQLGYRIDSLNEASRNWRRVRDSQGEAVP